MIYIESIDTYIFLLLAVKALSAKIDLISILGLKVVPFPHFQFGSDLNACNKEIIILSLNVV